MISKETHDIEEFRAEGVISVRNGGSYRMVHCPFCQCRFKAYVWSLAGGGKKCPGCGAVHGSMGQAWRPKKGAK